MQSKIGRKSANNISYLDNLKYFFLQIYFSMSFRRIAKDSVLRADMLSSQASLRYNGEPQYQSFCGGVMSIIVVLIFSAIFVNTIISVLQLQQISARQELANNLQSAEVLQDFMLAIGINGISQQQFQNYFSIALIQNANWLVQNDSGGPNKDWKDSLIPLVKCSLSQWTSFGISDMSTFYQRRNISTMYCPSPEVNYMIQGTSQESIYKFLTVIVTGCRQNVNNPNCVNQTQKQQFIQDWTTDKDFFQVQFYLLDTIITATNDNPISHYVQTDVFLAFTGTTGTVGTIKLADYEIDTDTNLLPWEQIQTQTGYFVDSFDTSTINQSKQKYVKLDISKSTKKITITRQYGKIDDVLSYVGGLFSLLFVVIQFFMMSYNEYKYQLAVGEALFNYDEKGTQFKQQDFGFLNYLAYSIYDWCAFFNCEPNWETCRRYHQTREQATQQLDVRYLMKKIRYLESVVQILINQDQQLCLTLTELPTLQKIQKKRKLSQFSRSIRQDQKRITNVIRSRKNSFQSRRSLMSENSKRVIPITEQMFPNPSSKNNDQITEHGFNFNQNQSQKSDNSDDIGFLVSQAFLRIQREKHDPVNRRIFQKIPDLIIDQVKGQRRQSRQRSRIKSGQIMEFTDIIPAQKMVGGQKISKRRSKDKINTK